jgi:hypothetical protein
MRTLTGFAADPDAGQQVDGPDGGPPWYVAVPGLVLTLFGVVIILALSAGGVLAALALSRATVQVSTTQTFRVGAQPALVVRGASGDVEIVAGGDGEVRVEARREARGVTARQARALLDETGVEISQAGDTVTVATRTAGGEPSGWPPLSRPGRVELLVWVPAATALDARLRQGDLQVHGVAGPLRAEVESGDAHLEDLRLSGANTLTLARGDATVQGELAPEATLDVQVSAGDVRVFLPPATAAVADAQTALGDVSVRGWPVPVRDTGRGQRASGALTTDLPPGVPGSAALRVRVAVGDVLVASRRGDAAPAPSGTPVTRGQSYERVD